MVPTQTRLYRVCDALYKVFQPFEWYSTQSNRHIRAYAIDNYLKRAMVIYHWIVLPYMYNISIVHTELCVVALTKEQSHIFSKRRTTVFVYVRCTDKCVMCVIHIKKLNTHCAFECIECSMFSQASPLWSHHWLHWLHTSRSHFDDNDKYDDAMMVALGGRLSNKNTGF